MLKPFRLLRWESQLQAPLVPAVLPCLGLKIALILLLRHFLTLNYSCFKHRKGRKLYIFINLRRLEIATRSSKATQAHCVWVRASEVIGSEHTGLISVLSDAK